MSKFKETIKNHWQAIVLALIIGAIFSLQHLAIPIKFGNPDKVYYPTLINMDESLFVGAKTNSVFQNGSIKGDVNLAENQEKPYLLPPLPHLAMGYLARLIGSVQKAFMAADFIMPIATFLIFYALALQFTASKILSMLFSAFSIFLPRALAFFPPLSKYYLAYFVNQIFKTQSRLYFDRFEDPQMTVPFFILAIILTIWALRTRKKAAVVFAGISYGVIFYVYFYYYVYFSAALFLAGAIFFFQKNSKKELQTVLTIAAVGLAISIPHWLNFFQLARLPEYGDIVSRIGPQEGRHLYFYPIALISYFLHAVLALLIYKTYHKVNPVVAPFIMGLLAAVFLVYNFQIITDYNPQPNHWIKPSQIIAGIAYFILFLWLIQNRSKIPQKFIKTAAAAILAVLAFKGSATQDNSIRIIAWGSFFALSAFFLAFWRISKKSKQNQSEFWLAAGRLAIFLIILKGVLSQAAFIKENGAEAFLSKAESASFEWLDKNTPKNSVVGSISFVTNSRIQSYTHNKILVPICFNTFATNEEIMDRFMFINKISGTDNADFTSFFATPENPQPQDSDHAALNFLFGEKYKPKTEDEFYSYKGPVISQEKLAEFAQQYGKFLSSNKTMPYRIDYFYLGPREKKLIKKIPIQIEELEKIYDKDGIEIYGF